MTCWFRVPRSNEANMHRHGFSFANAWDIFEAPTLIDLDDRLNY